MVAHRISTPGARFRIPLGALKIYMTIELNTIMIPIILTLVLLGCLERILVIRLDNRNNN
jgi:hypothetical protein